MRLRQLSSSGRPVSRTLNKNSCLPPVGQTFPSITGTGTSSAAGVATPGIAASYSLAVEKLAEAAVTASTVDSLDEPATAASLLSTAATLHLSPSIKEDHAEVTNLPKMSTISEPDSEDPDFIPSTSTSLPRKDLYTMTSNPSSGLEMLPTALLPQAKRASKGESGGLETFGELLKQSPVTAHKELTTSSLRGDGFSRPTTSTRFPGMDLRKEYALESLSTGQARAVSGLLRQASIEKLGTSHIGSLVSSASKSRLGSYCIQEARSHTPENRLMVSETYNRMF